MQQRASFHLSDLVVVKRATLAMLIVPGSFVKLNSGSPIGVVTCTQDNDDCAVTWLSDGYPRSILPECCLTPVVG